MTMDNEILELLDKDSELSAKDIAVMLGITEEEVAQKIERFKAESLNNNDVEEIEEILDDFNMMFWTIPSKYREDILPKLNEYALIKGVEIGLDVFNQPEPKMVFTLLSE